MLFKIRSSSPEQVTSRAVRAITAPVLEAPYIHILIFAIRQYIDPPYWDCEGYYGKGIFSREDFAVLAGLLAAIRGKFILSLNDTPGVRETFAGFTLETAEVNYTCSNGRNIKSPELLIRNF